MSRRWAWVAVAFVVGLVAGGALVFEGELSGAPDRPAPTARTGPVVLRIENVGTHDVNATMEVARTSGGTVWSGSMLVPRGGEHGERVSSGLSGHFSAKGVFSWSAPPRQPRGDFIILFEGDECGGRTLEVVFRVDTTDGIEFPDGAVKRCL